MELNSVGHVKMTGAMTSSRHILVQRVIWLGIIVLACLRSFSLIHYDPRATVPRTPETARVAYFLRTQGAFANPYAPLPTGPTAHVAPGYPALLAAIYWVFGTGAVGAFMFQAVDASIMVLQVALIPAAATALGAGRWTGLLAALFSIGGLHHSGPWEASFSGLILIVSTLLACRYFAVIETGPISRTSLKVLNTPGGVACVTGVLWGIQLLTAPNTGPVWVAWILAAAWISRRRGLPRAWLPAAVVPILLVLPWIVRNQALFHSLIPVRGNLGLELWVSHNPCAKITFIENLTSGCFPHPNHVLAEAQEMARIGEVEYNRTRLHYALAWIRDNPTRAFGMWIRRTTYFWFPLPDVSLNAKAPRQRWSFWVVDVLTVFTIPGLVLLWRGSRPGAAICAIFLVLYPLIYYFMQWMERYRFPIVWVTFILAAVAIRSTVAWLWSKARGRFPEPPRTSSYGAAAAS
jgi:hypothetical protein